MRSVLAITMAAALLGKLLLSFRKTYWLAVTHCDSDPLGVSLEPDSTPLDSHNLDEVVKTCEITGVAGV